MATHKALDDPHTAKQVPSINATGVRFIRFVTSPTAHMLGTEEQECSSTCKSRRKLQSAQKLHPLALTTQSSYIFHYHRIGQKRLKYYREATNLYSSGFINLNTNSL